LDELGQRRDGVQVALVGEVGWAFVAHGVSLRVVMGSGFLDAWQAAARYAARLRRPSR